MVTINTQGINDRYLNKEGLDYLIDRIEEKVTEKVIDEIQFATEEDINNLFK